MSRILVEMVAHGDDTRQLGDDAMRLRRNEVSVVPSGTHCVPDLGSRGLTPEAAGIPSPAGTSFVYHVHTTQ